MALVTDYNISTRLFSLFLSSIITNNKDVSLKRRRTRKEEEEKKKNDLKEEETCSMYLCLKRTLQNFLDYKKVRKFVIQNKNYFIYIIKLFSFLKKVEIRTSRSINKNNLVDSK